MMQRYKVASGEEQQIPAVGSVGLGKPGPGPQGRTIILFYPDDPKQLPCPAHEFMGYAMAPEEMIVVEQP